MAVKVSYRAVFMSDLHMGCGTSCADEATEFLKHIDCETLYLVGDIIDMWRLKSRWRWPESHHRFVRRVLKMAAKGTRVVFIPGNHDDHARRYVGLNFGGIEVAMDAVHTTADGRRLLVTHGDECDVVVKHATLLSVMGGTLYDHLVGINRWYNMLRRLRGKPYWSFSYALKLKVKAACQYVARFEDTIEQMTLQRGLDGVVCGHIHKAEIRKGRIEYYNCGDWVESATAIVEHDDGKMQVIDGRAFIGQFVDTPESGVEPVAIDTTSGAAEEARAITGADANRP